MSWAEEQCWFGMEDVALEAEQREQELFENCLWETKDKQVIRISEMETSHIKNSIRCINGGRIRGRERYLPLLELELINRGENEK